MNKITILFAALLYMMPALGQKNDADKIRLTEELEQIYMESHIIGFSVAIVNKDGILFTKGFGYSDRKANERYTEHTLQNIASISKTFIGIALLKAQELGKLTLDDPINNYLPFKVINPYFPDEPITIRQLATHTATLKDPSVYEKRGYILKEVNKTGTKANANFKSPEEIVAMQVFLESIFNPKGKWYKKRNFLKMKPGEIFEYSNLGAGLAAYIIELATETSFSEFTAKHILEPLGMSASGWRFVDIDMSKHSKLYLDTETQLPFYSLVNYADGGLISSASDMGKYLSELINGQNGRGKILTKTSFSELFTPQLTAGNFEERNESDYNDEYNSGIFMGFSAAGYIGHTGSDPGVASFMFFDPKTRIGKILMVNTDLGKEGVKEFIEIWDILGKYEME
ncbi:CubicO group peptidase (beta-lactamase class C family) [Flavobacteriaceae bacterium MAR_2009_75]|nr:CubicO group peptidase (beta-lactamase class C family) [Flavobacteriaceae bacterium MAR_2009_75]